MIKSYLESNINFEFEESEIFLIEKEPFYDKNLKSYGVKVCDFIWCKTHIYKNPLWLIEVKSSSPKESKELNSYCQDITKKFNDSILIFVSTLHKRYNTQNLSKICSNQKILSQNIRCILIVDTKTEYLMKIKDYLNKVTKSLRKAFALEDLWVLNPELAKKKGFKII